MTSYQPTENIAMSDISKKLHKEWVRKHEAHWDMVKRTNPESYFNVFVDDYDRLVNIASDKLDDMFEESSDES